MMDDHEQICAVRNSLADALKVLLQAGIMFKEDFVGSREHVLRALLGLDELISQEDARAAQTLRARDAGIR
jgi:hypothetical protein